MSAFSWKMGFLGMLNLILTFTKSIFRKKALIYINQASLTMKKEPIFYCTYVVLGQIIPLSSPPPNLENYVCKENEVKLLVPMYNTANGLFQGIKNPREYVERGYR